MQEVMDMDFDKGWSRLEKLLLFGGILLATVAGYFAFRNESIGYAAFVAIWFMAPWFIAKIVKWIIDGFRG